MRKITLQNKFTALVLLLSFIGVTGWGQTNPTAQSLPYTQNFGTTTFATMPTGMAAWNGLNGASITTQSDAEASAPSGNAPVATATGATTTGGVHGYAASSNARAYIQTSSNATNGANQIALAVNTTGRTSITVSYDVEIISAQPRTVGVVLQYRVGTSGGWTTVTGTGNPYSQAGGSSGVKVSPIFLLPAACEGQSVVQLRWATWRGTEGGASSGIAIDNINVTGLGTVYTWTGATDLDYNVSTNWSPNRGSPGVLDVLQFTSSPSGTITNVQNQSIGSLIVSGSTTSVTLRSSSAVGLTIQGGINALSLSSGCTLNLSATTDANAITLTVASGSTGSINGDMAFSGVSSCAHRLIGTNSSSIVFNNGAVFTSQSTQSGAPFGAATTAYNNIIFANGSVYRNRVNGGSPFGVGAPNSKVVFQSGSTYRMQQNSNPFIGGRTVANFEIDAASFNQTITSASATNITGNLVITSATSVTFDFTGGLTVGGNITRTLGTVSFSPASAANLTLNGTSDQTISGAITFSSNLNLVINKASGLAILGGDYTINRDLTLTSGTLSIGANTLTLAGTVSGSGLLRGGATSNLSCTNTSALGSLFFDHSTDGTTNALNNFTKTGAGSVTIGNNASATIAQLYINGALDIQAGSLDVNQAVTGNHLVLVSNGTNLARVADLGVAGTRLTQGPNTKIVVERSTLNKRAWRLIAAPLTGNGLGLNTTVQSQWQNTGNILGTDAFGTNIYGPSGSGFDATRPGYSMLRWNYGLQNWRNVTNTTTEPMFGNGASGYTSTTDSTVLPTFLFARGDKTITATTGSNAGRLRAVGKLLTGTQTFNYPGVGAGTKYVAVSNPYAAPVDFESLIAGLSGNLKNLAGNTIFYYWDPSLNNFGGAFGGWVTVTRDNGGGYTQNSGTNGRYIQSGTVILIQPSDQASSTAIFEESYKASGSNVSPATHGAGTNTIDKLVVQLKNADNAIGTLDGSIAMFGNGYKKEFDKTEDGIKLEQNNETISFVNGSLKTGVESRGYIQQADTLQMNLLRTTTGTNYSFEFNPSNFDATVLDAKLVDKFLNTETPLSLSAKTTVPFSVTATTGSNAADRFMIVFRGTGALPNKGFTVTGEKLGTNKVKVNWEAQAETGVKEYALEKSTDGVNYQTVNTQAAKNGNVANSYTYTDNTPVNGLNYYRVKTTQHNDIERYSTVITVNFKQQSTNNVVVYPNPVKGNTIGLQLQDLEKGMYSVRILSIEGKEVYKQQLQVNGSSLNTTINPSTKLAQGTYTLQVVGKSTTYTQKVVVE